jgi:hypothetical protein
MGATVADAPHCSEKSVQKYADYCWSWRSGLCGVSNCEKGAQNGDEFGRVWEWNVHVIEGRSERAERYGGGLLIRCNNSVAERKRMRAKAHNSQRKALLTQRDGCACRDAFVDARVLGTSAGAIDDACALLF